MKKFVNVCLIIAAIFVFSGALFFGIGYAIGGMDFQTNIAEGLRQSFINEEAFKIEYHINSSDNDDTEEITFDNWNDSKIKVYQGDVEQVEIASREEISEINCKVGACKVVFKTSPNDSYMVESTAKGSFRCYQKDGVLYFAGVKDITYLKDQTGQITIYIPKEVELDTFILKASACEINIEEINAKEFNCEIGAGKVSINEVISENVLIELGAGELYIASLETNIFSTDIGAGEIKVRKGTADIMEISVGMGNVEIGLIETNKLNVVCAMGNIEVMIDGNEDDYDTEAKCVAGNVSIGESGGVIFGVSKNSGNTDKSIFADCAMGNIEIKFSK